MPQFHSARDIHDVYYIKQPQYAKTIAEPYLTQVALAHENGWQTVAAAGAIHSINNLQKNSF